jgi:hypothetical protein
MGGSIVNLFVSMCLSIFFSIHANALEIIDGCTSIRQQLSALPDTGGEVLIPEGSYTCSSPIILDKRNVWLHGAGKVNLILANMANSPVILMGQVHTPPENIKNVKVSDLSIDGNKANQTQECWNGECDKGGTTFIRNNGISVRAITDGEIKNVSIKDGRSAGVVTERGCFNFHVDNLSVTGSEFDGFAGYQTYGSLFENMNLFGNRAAGISIDIDFSTNTIRNTVLEKNGDVGIFMRDSRANIFDDVIIKNNGSHGVFLAQAHDGDFKTCASDNEFKDLSVISSKGAGFQLNDPCLKNRLTGHALLQGNRNGCIGEVNKANVDIEGSLTCI